MESEKYNRLIEALKRSGPVFDRSGEIADKVIRQIQAEKSEINYAEIVTGYLFGWVYISWVRKALVAAALILVAIFSWQQAVILQRVNQLSEQRIESGIYLKTSSFETKFDRLMMNSSVDKDFKGISKTFSEKDIDQMIRSFYKLQNQYHDLFYLIQNDPQVRKMVEEKLNKLEKQKNK